MYGGAGSGKSVSSSQIIVLSMMNGRNQLIVRKIARTLKRSVFNEVQKAMWQLNLNKYFAVNRSDMTIKCINGAVAYFVGCDDPEKLKSITPPKGMFNDIHIEEATEITFEDFMIIDTRQRGESNLPRRLFLRLNPIHQNHWIKKTFFDGDKYDVYAHHTTCLDNRFLSDTDKERYENYKNQSEYMYSVYYLGNWGVLAGVIFKYTVVKERPETLRGVRASYGQDFGWTNPSATVRTFSNDSTIYVDDEIYETKLTTDRLAEQLREFAKDEVVWCDSEDPRTITQLKGLAIQAIGVKKGQGSVIAGIKFIQNKTLLINERCVNLIKELESYQWGKDRQGNEIDKPEKTNDHAIDALRYSLEEEMLQTRVIVGW